MGSGIPSQGCSLTCAMAKLQRLKHAMLAVGATAVASTETAAACSGWVWPGFGHCLDGYKGAQVSVRDVSTRLSHMVCIHTILANFMCLRLSSAHLKALRNNLKRTLLQTARLVYKWSCVRKYVVCASGHCTVHTLYNCP